MEFYLGIDIGTSATKTLLIDATGSVQAQATGSYPILQPQAGWTEQDPEEWWKATIKTVRSVIQSSGVAANHIRGIGLSGQMHGTVFLDQNDQVIRPALLWNDQRTAAECDEITSRAGSRESLIQMVANPALTGFSAPKILWLRNHEPNNFERLNAVLLPKDEIRRRLTGHLATDVSDASGTLLLDVVRRQWSKPLLAKLELDPALFPEVFESEEITGTLTSEAAKMLGLTTDCKVVAGAGDCAAGAIGNGIVRSGILCTSIGTSGVVFAHSDQPEYDPTGRLHTFCHAVRNKWHLMGVNLTSGGALQWWVDSVLRGFSTDSPYGFETATKEASTIPAGSDGLVFLPYLNGERAPHADPDARGALIGLNSLHHRAHVTRAVMEGVTFALRDNLDIIAAAGVPIDQIRVSGGGSQNPLWRQIQADVFGQNVLTLEVEQGPAYGAALLAAVGTGTFKSIEQACDATIKTVGQTSVVDRNARIYEQMFPLYQQLYGQLRNTFSDLAQLPSETSEHGLADQSIV